MNQQLKRYFQDLTRVDNDVLDREEEKELARRVKAGDQKAKEELVEHNLRLVVDIASNYRELSLDYSDLIQAGNLGLMKALKRFEPELGNKFSTYAYWWIRQSILRALDKQTRTVRLPAGISGLKRKINQLTREHRDREGEEPSVEQLAEKLDASEEQIKRAIRANQSTKSLDQPLEEDGEGMTRTETVEGEKDYSPRETNRAEFARERLYRLMEEELTDRERRVLRLRFGLEDHQPRTLKEVSEVFDLSQEMIRQLQDRALDKLRAEIPRKTAGNI